MIRVFKFRANDLNPTAGKQIEFNSEVVSSFFQFNQDEVYIDITYKSLGSADSSLNGQRFNNYLKLSPARGDYKIYGNTDGSLNMKTFFLDKLNLTLDNIGDYFALVKNNSTKYDLYYIPKTTDMSNFYSVIKGRNIEPIPTPEEVSIPKSPLNQIQKIYFGAPGTGKSHTIKEATSDSDNKITTTFHPDTDYASFVGCYKPQVDDDGKTITYKFTPQAFAKAYVSAWRLLLGESADISSIDNESRYRAWLPENNVAKAFGYYIRNIKSVDVTKYEDTDDIFDISDPNIIDEIINDKYPDPAVGKEVGHMRAHLNKYKAFLQSLEPASTPKSDDKNFYLVIEEINRGNCAQVFGDLFQLLDRNEEGFSDYVIDVDKDFADYLLEELAGLNGYKDRICALAGIENTNHFTYSKIALPCNLSILATMNTSDQSLFPMDSAFKRRWDWEYIPINASEVEDVTINIGENRYSWSEFITKVNVKIEKAHDSEDKQLGPYFVKATKKIVDGIELKYITQEQFVSKVMFYLWYEVFKDEVSNTIFITKEKKEGQDKLQDTRFTFNKLFVINTESKKSEVNCNMLEKFLGDSLEMKPLPNPAKSEANVESTESTENAESTSEQSAPIEA